ncbi:MAG: epoxyqueuosine reductase QueH [Deltaproteobacteria bacterium]|jgi:predicted adenine nucleotide alpha hydrolase (AANH) superfamily ATPase|nr:epoxyqueuosine reductase QueH [Deltaproteobacteria bacterium]
MPALLLHVCCAPCAVLPLTELLRRSLGSPGYFNPIYPWFYNPNIQPKEEFIRRRDALAFLCSQIPLLVPGADIAVDFSPPYEPHVFLETVASEPDGALEPKRCQICYRLRLKAAAIEAHKRGFEAFSTTLLYSRRQKHDLILAEGHLAAQEIGVKFYDEDFRQGWSKGVELGKKLGLYRQRWCGCVYGAS